MLRELIVACTAMAFAKAHTAWEDIVGRKDRMAVALDIDLDLYISRDYCSLVSMESTPLSTLSLFT